MDVNRLCLALEAARNEYSELGLEARLQNLASSLSQLAAQPGDSNVATTFKTQFGELATVLQNAQSNLAPPIRRMTWDAVHLSNLMGIKLAARITKIIDDNRMTPQLAVKEMTALLEEVKTAMGLANTVTAGLAVLGLATTSLGSGEYELGFSFPKTLVKPQADLVADEMHGLQKVLRAFAEVTGAPIDSVVLKDVASSDWQFFFDAYAPTAAFLAVAIERIVTLYKTHLEIRKLKRDLESKEFPEQLVAEMQKYIDGNLRSEIEKVATELIAQNYKGDEGRKNELTISVRHSLIYLADRLDNGVSVEVNVAPPVEPAKPPNIDDPAIAAEFQKKLEDFQVAKQLADSTKTRGAAVATLMRDDQPILKLTGDVNERTGVDPNN